MNERKQGKRKRKIWFCRQLRLHEKKQVLQLLCRLRRGPREKSIGLAEVNFRNRRRSFELEKAREPRVGAMR